MPLPPDYRKLRPLAARIQHFRCFHDSGWVPLESVTTLVAENEFGKTSFLEALAWFGTTQSLAKDDLRVGAPTDAPIVSLRYELEHQPRFELTNNAYLGPDKVDVSKYADGTYLVFDSAKGTNVAEPHLQSFTNTYEDARSGLISNLSGFAYPTAPDIDLAAHQAASDLRDAKPGDERASAAAGHFHSLTSHLGEQPPFGQIALLCERLVRAENDLRAAPGGAIELLRPFLADLVYFDGDVDLLPDKIIYEPLRLAPSEHPTEANLAKLMGLDVLAIPADGFGRHQQGQTLSHKLTGRFARFWDTPNDQEMRIELHEEEDEMHVIVHHIRAQPPSRRSRGLRWFLGFYTKFAAETDDQLRDTVLLIDEPGLSLHIKQQSRFLDLLDELSEANTIVYSTHLPYLIPRNRLSRVRLFVADPNHPGAVTVESKVHALPSDSDVLKPIRAALGVGIADSITLGGSTLVVEGMADMYLIDAMRRFCARAGKTALPDDVTILPAGGNREKMMPLAAFLASGQMKGALLVDSDTSGRETQGLAKERFDEMVAVAFTHSADDGQELSIEDLIDRDYYLGLANATLSDRRAAAPIAPQELSDAPLCKAVQEAFAAKGYGDFQKLKAALVLQVRADLDADPPPETTLDAFAELFGRLSDSGDTPED